MFENIGAVEVNGPSNCWEILCAPAISV